MNQMTAYCVVGREFNHLKLEILLKKSEFKVIFFTNALNALTRCLEDIPDVVFLYNGIDDLNWNEFLKSFRKVNAHTPVIVITPNNSQYVRTTALKSGATDIYSHSLLSEEFTARFSMILNLCLQNKELETKSILLDSEIKKVTQRVRESEWETLWF